MTRNLKSFRAKYGLTQMQMAEKLDITTATYSFKENGKKQFTLEEAKKIAEIFNTTIDNIFFSD